MASSTAQTVTEYLASLPEDRRTAISTIRDRINANLPAGYQEGMQYGMIGWYIPLSRYPDTYNKQPLGIAALASQKGNMALYLMSVYGDPAIETWFRQSFANAGKKLDMGKSCVRFKKLEDLPLDVIGETIAKVSVESYLEKYEAIRANTKTGKAKTAKAAKAAKATTTKANTKSGSAPKSKPSKAAKAAKAMTTKSGSAPKSKSKPSKTKTKVSKALKASKAAKAKATKAKASKAKASKASKAKASKASKAKSKATGR